MIRILRAWEVYELGQVFFMNLCFASRNETECLFSRKPSAILLSLTSGLLAVYPWFLRLSLFMARLMQ